MRILVAGRTGQLARALKALDHGESAITTMGRPELDVTDSRSIEAAIQNARADIVVNAAAYTAVDKAENDREQADLLNAHGARNVAAAAARAGLPVIHMSTDYVFSGDIARPYVENDACAPLSVYGVTKLAGEQAVREVNFDHLILRTAWIFSAHGANFLTTMLRLASMQDQVRVVADQFGTPTYADDLARAIVTVCGQIVSKDRPAWQGTCHLVPRGQTSWAGFAAEIFRLSEHREGPSAKVVPIATSDYPTRAVRPRYSVLDPGLFEKRFGIALPEWQDATRRCLAAAVWGPTGLRS